MYHCLLFHETRSMDTLLKELKFFPNDSAHTGLTHWGWVTHICVSKLTIIGSDNGLSPGQRQALIWTIAGILLIRTLETNLSEILSEISAFSFKKRHLKMSSAKWRQLCLGLNVLTTISFSVIAGLNPDLVSAASDAAESLKGDTKQITKDLLQQLQDHHRRTEAQKSGEAPPKPSEGSVGYVISMPW